jgi:excisionase family DNA binding protein
MSLGELAQWLEVDEETVRSLAEAGELPGRRLGEEWRFARAAVLDWLAAR